MQFREMLFLLYGHQKQDPSGTGSIGSLPKYGVSAAQTCDGPAGVRRASPSTYFPCAALLACSFDPALLNEIGGVIGAEAAEVDFDLLLAPGLCIHRHPLCGRNFEYFSEDPLVSGVCAAEYVKGVQSKGVGATVKHFAGNNREGARRIEKDIVSERAFREIYLRGFERAIKEAEPWAVMTAYNGINGFNCGENYGLLTGILRGEWGYKGLTMTDWVTTVPMWREIGAGNDVKMPGILYDPQGNVKKFWGVGTDEAEAARDRGYLSVAMVRESARRVCELVMKTRRFAREREEARR
jgi:beta-glucosidase